PYSLLEHIERFKCAFQKRLPVYCQRHPMGAAIKKADADRILKIGHRLRHGRLGNRKMRRSFRHASEFDDSEQDLQVAQFNTMTDSAIGIGGSWRHRKILYPYLGLGHSSERSSPLYVNLPANERGRGAAPKACYRWRVNGRVRHARPYQPP